MKNKEQIKSGLLHSSMKIRMSATKMGEHTFHGNQATTKYGKKKEGTVYNKT